MSADKVRQEAGCLLEIVAVALLVLVFWVLMGGYREHCETHPTAAMCTFVFGTPTGGPDAQ